MKLASTKGKTVDQTYLIESAKTHVLAVEWSDDQDQTVAEAFKPEDTGMTPQQVRGLQTRIDNGSAVYVATCITCTNTQTGAVGTAYLGGTYGDSLDAIWSNAISGYYSQLVDEAKEEAGVQQA